MSWEVVGATGERAGALIIIASLFYISIQVRESVRIAKSQIREQRAQSSQEVQFRWAEHADVMAKARQGSPLTEVERVQLEMIFRATMRGWEASFYHHQNGLLDDTEWESVRTNVQDTLSTDHWREL